MRKAVLLAVVALASSPSFPKEIDHSDLSNCTYARERQVQYAKWVDEALESADSGWNCKHGPATCYVMLRDYLSIIDRKRLGSDAFKADDELCNTKVSLLARMLDQLNRNRVEELRAICQDQYGDSCE